MSVFSLLFRASLINEVGPMHPILYYTVSGGANSFWERMIKCQEASRRTFGANAGHFNIKIIRRLRINSGYYL